LSHFKLGEEIQDLQSYLNSLCRGFVAQLHSNNRKVAAADLESAVLQIQAASDYLQYWLANYQSADATLYYYDNSNSC
jgi:hypothetical protein